MYQEIEHSTDDAYDSAVTQKWNQDFQAVSWLKMPKIDLELLSSSLSAQRNRSVSGISGRPGVGRIDSTAAYDYAALGHAEMQDLDMPDALYQSILEPEVFLSPKRASLYIEAAE